MKYKIPLLVSFFSGLFMIISEFIPHKPFGQITSGLEDWFMIIAGFAMILGIISLIQINFYKIRYKHPDRLYAWVCLISFFTMVSAGLIWGSDEKRGILPSRLDKAKEAFEQAFAANPQMAKAQLGLAAVYNQKGLEKSAGEATAAAVALDPTLGDYDITTEDTLSVEAATAAVQSGAGAQTWYVLGRSYLQDNREPGAFMGGKKLYNYLFDNLYMHLSSTMFALLAFFIASAAYRAFIARSLHANLLLISALIVMLGNTGFGGAITGWLPDSLSLLRIPDLAFFIMKYLSTAGQRAIMVAAALGVAGASLRIILGIERSYLGGE